MEYTTKATGIWSILPALNSPIPKIVEEFLPNLQRHLHPRGIKRVFLSSFVLNCVKEKRERERRRKKWSFITRKERKKKEKSVEGGVRFVLGSVDRL